MNDSPDHPPPQPVPLAYSTSAVPRYPGSPWFAIWTRPRDVMRWALATDPTRNVVGLIAAGSIAEQIGTGFEDPTSVDDIIVSLGLSLTIGAAISFTVAYFVLPWLLTVVGRWFGGRGERVGLRAVVAHLSITTVWLAIPSTSELATVAFLLATGRSADALFELPWLPLAIGIYAVLLVFGLWSIVIWVRCVAIAHQFSDWAALGTGLVVTLLAAPVAVAVLVAFYSLS